MGWRSPLACNCRLIEPRLTARVSQKPVVAAMYATAMFMSVIDSSIVNVALPTIGQTFGVPTTSVDTVSIYYLVSFAVFIPASGWLGDRFGSKRVLITAIAVFTVGSALCGIAGSLTVLALFHHPGQWRRHAPAGRLGHAVPRLSR